MEQPRNSVALLVNAQPVVARRDLDGDDALVPGVHVIYVNAGVSPKHLANAALDVLHSTVPVSVLDDFSFDVVDPTTHRVLQQDPDIEGYELIDQGEYGELASSEPMQIATVRVQAVASGQPSVDLGEVTVAGWSWSDIERKAAELQWDDRMRTAGYAPHCERASSPQRCAPGERQR